MLSCRGDALTPPPRTHVHTVHTHTRTSTYNTPTNTHARAHTHTFKRMYTRPPMCAPCWRLAQAYASATTNESVSKGPVRSYKDNRKKIALRRPKAADLPPKLAARINSSPRYQLEREFYKHALELHTERTAKLPGFAQQVEVFVSACNQAGQKAARVKGTRHTSR